MKSKIIFVIGGTRSGKSRFALDKASLHTGQKAYIATAEALDDEMEERIEKHKKERSAQWATFEEPINIADVLLIVKNKYNAALLDCLTLWLSNIQNPEHRLQNTEHRQQGPDYRQQEVKESIQQFADTLKRFKKPSACALGSEPCVLYVVSNEVGMGIVPDNELSRRFRDLSGWLNQLVAEIADEVYLVTAGIPIKIK